MIFGELDKLNLFIIEGKLVSNYHSKKSDLKKEVTSIYIRNIPLGTCLIILYEH